MKTRAVLAVAMVVGLSATGCASVQNGPGPVQPGTNAPRPTDTGGKATSGGSQNTAKPADDKGVADVTFDGTSGNERVSCDGLSTEFKVVAKEGRTRWTASAKRSPNFADKLAAQGVEVQPAQGVLEQGQSSVIRVRGSFDKSNKYFYVVVVSRDGSTSHSMEFKCR